MLTQGWRIREQQIYEKAAYLEYVHWQVGWQLVPEGVYLSCNVPTSQKDLLLVRGTRNRCYCGFRSSDAVCSLSTNAQRGNDALPQFLYTQRGGRDNMQNILYVTRYMLCCNIYNFKCHSKLPSQLSTLEFLSVFLPPFPLSRTQTAHSSHCLMYSSFPP